MKNINSKHIKFNQEQLNFCLKKHNPLNKIATKIVKWSKDCTGKKNKLT